jgi:hypothetical protein
LHDDIECKKRSSEKKHIGEEAYLRRSISEKKHIGEEAYIMRDLM